MKPFVLTTIVFFAVSSPVVAQRPRSVSKDSDKPAPTTSPTAAPAPTTFKAKYEGGAFGYNHKVNGTLTFEDLNNRLVFRDEKQKEMVSIPYNSVTGAYGDTHAVQPKSATIASNVPSIYSLPAHFIKTKVQYLTIQYSDPDSNVSGITSFKVANSDLLNSVLLRLAGKAGLIQRGEIFVKKK